MRARQKKPPIGDTRLRQCKHDENRWLEAAPTPDNFAPLARGASRAESLQGSDAYRISDLVETVEVRQQAGVLKYLFSWHMDIHGRGDADGETRQRGEKIHSGTMTPTGWSDAAHGEQSANGKCRPGNVIGFTSSALRGPCHII